MVRSVAEGHEKGKVAACWRRLLASFVERVDWNFPAPEDDFRGSLPSLERASQTTREGFCGPSPNFSQQVFFLVIGVMEYIQGYGFYVLVVDSHAGLNARTKRLKRLHA